MKNIIKLAIIIAVLSSCSTPKVVVNIQDYIIKNCEKTEDVIGTDTVETYACRNLWNIPNTPYKKGVICGDVIEGDIIMQVIKK